MKSFREKYDESLSGADADFDKLEQMCKKHDRWYMMSDDHGVYTRGYRDYGDIMALANKLKSSDEGRVKKILQIIGIK